MIVRRSSGRRRDDGSVLPLVLVLMVVAGLIVIPLLGYTMAVFRSNTVLTQRTAAVEAAKGGVRMAVGDPKNVFQTCDDGGDLTPLDPATRVINKIGVTVTCTEIAEYGPNEALGFEVPISAVAMQAGARVPLEFSGLDQPPLLPVQSPPVPPYPDLSTTPDWWSGQESPNPTNDKIWMPYLPRIPGAVRTSTPFSMPAAFVNCKVFFPGSYAAPLLLNGNNKYYFASGVYYFEAQVKIEGNADVVVGYGLDELPNPDCSDDIQVAANVVGTPGTFDISGGGATWVFGKSGRLVVDDVATTTTLRLRFNQRYDTADRGGRISIMSVNGNDTAVAEHLVNNVNRVPRSTILNITDEPEPDPDTVVIAPIAGTLYAPSTSTSLAVPLGLTDKARVPLAPSGFTALPFQYTDVATQRGAILLTWDEVTGQTAGGAFVDGYTATISPTASGPICQPADLVVSTVAGVNKVSCLVKGLNLSSTGTNYTVGVAARNWIGTGAQATGSARPRTSSPVSPVITAPLAPTNVAAVGSDIDDVAQISWTAPANGGTPITSYEATAHRIYLQAHADQPPVAGNMDLVMRRDRTRVYGVPAFDPNGEALSLQTVDTTGFPAAVGTVTFAGLDVSIATTPGGPLGTYTIPYTVVANPSGAVAGGTISVRVFSSTPSDRDPIARSLPLSANVGVPIVSRVPAYDPDAHTMSLTVDLTGLTAPQWTVTKTGLDVAITTTAPDGTYTIPYTVTDSEGDSDGDFIVVTVLGDEEVVGASCQVTAPSPGVPLANACDIPLPDLVPGDGTTGNVGYRFDVVATNAIGSSAPGSNPAPYPLAFDGGGTALPPPPAPAVRTFEPWRPTPIIEILAHNADPLDVRVAIAGYVSVPMGNIAVTNTDRDDVKINGGVLAGTFAIQDSRAVIGTQGSLPMGFKNDIVLQRKIKIVAIARNITSVAIVQVNEDGASLGINSWVTQ